MSLDEKPKFWLRKCCRNLCFHCGNVTANKCFHRQTYFSRCGHSRTGPPFYMFLMEKRTRSVITLRKRKNSKFFRKPRLPFILKVIYYSYINFNYSQPVNPPSACACTQKIPDRHVSYLFDVLLFICSPTGTISRKGEPVAFYKRSVCLSLRGDSAYCASCSNINLYIVIGDSRRLLTPTAASIEPSFAWIIAEIIGTRSDLDVRYDVWIFYS